MTDVSVLWFTEQGAEPTVLAIDADGRMRTWPRGFFDTTEDLLMQLM